MKLLLFSDVHCDEKQCDSLVDRSNDADIVIGAGDFSTFRRGLELPIAILKRIRKPTILVPGNSESVEELSAECKDWQEATVLHGEGCRINNTDFYGVGGGIPVTPFGDWSYDFNEKEAEALLSDCPAGGILVTHSPPHGALDRVWFGKHLGSTAIRETVLEKKPVLVVCGHIHECSGRQAELGSAVVINAGPEGIVWEI